MALRASLTFDNLMNYAEAVGFTAILTTGSLVRADIVTVGAVTAAALLFHRLFGPLGVLFMSFANVLRAAAVSTRLVGVADLPLPTPSDRPFQQPPVGVAVEGVSHRYPDGPTVLHDVSVRVPAGGSLAVVGESGAGKTTLAALIGGVFPASDGAIALGDDAVDGLDPHAVRRRVAVVTQEVHTFAGTLADDLRLARPDATDDDLEDALRTVGALDWVVALPGGLGTRVGTGGYPLTVDQAAAARAGPDHAGCASRRRARRGDGGGGQRGCPRPGTLRGRRDGGPDRCCRGPPPYPGPGLRRDRGHVGRSDRRAGHARPVNSPPAATTPSSGCLVGLKIHAS